MFECLTSVCPQSSITEVCQQFPDKVSCDFHVTQVNTDVDPQLQSSINRQ